MEANEEWLRKIVFEYTPRDSPEFNGKIERKFATLYRRVRAVLNAAKLTKKLRDKLWGEAVIYSTDLENLLMSRSYSQQPYKMFYKKEFPHANKLRQFGEIAVVK